MKYNQNDRAYDNNPLDQVLGCLIAPFYLLFMLVAGVVGVVLMAINYGWWLIVLFILGKALGWI